MPLRRTPPSSPALTLSAATPPTPSGDPAPPAPLSAPVSSLTVPFNQQLLHSSSEPSLNVTLRRKKQAQSDEYKLNDFMEEMRSMFLLFKEDQNKRADRLYAAVDDLRISVDFLGKNLESAQARIVELEAIRQADVQHIKVLEDRLDALERGCRSSCLEIRNVPVAPSETKSSLVDNLIKVGEAIKVSIQKNDIKDIFRIRSKDPAKRTIIVELCSNLQKENIINKYRNFNKGTLRLTTEHLRISGPPKPIFVSENLTAKMKRLFFLARDYAKVNDYNFCWVSHGKIFLRKRENGPLIRVTSELDLEKLQVQK